MAPSLGDAPSADLEHSCGPDEWVDATRAADGVELFRARLPGCPAGFADQSHFTRTFKTAFGMPPAATRGSAPPTPSYALAPYL